MSLFLQNKYTKVYDCIVSNAQCQIRKKLKKNNPRYEYFESHHIVPKSLGGSNDDINLVLLTPKEHYVCHLLLTKMCVFPKHRNKMLYAFNRTSQKNKRLKINSSMYARLKKELSVMKTLTCSGSLNHFYGKTHTQDVKNHLSMVCPNYGVDNGFFGKTHTDKIKTHLSNLAKLRVNIPPPPQIGERNYFAKHYHITYPDGCTSIIKCLKTFIQKHNMCNHTIKIYKNKGVIPVLQFERIYRVKNIQQKRNCEGYSIQVIAYPSGIFPSIDQTVT